MDQHKNAVGLLTTTQVYSTTGEDRLKRWWDTVVPTKMFELGGELVEVDVRPVSNTEPMLMALCYDTVAMLALAIDKALSSHAMDKPMRARVTDALRAGVSLNGLAGRHERAGPLIWSETIGP